MDRFFYSLPGFKQLATFLTQSERPLDFNEIVEHFSSLEQADLAIFPEGSNCFFGLPDEIQNFRSSRFIEIAIRARAPILVCVHRGSENWGLPIRLQTEWLKILNDLPAPVVQWLDTYLKFEERAKKAEMLTLPIVPTRMERFDMMCKLYHPEVRLGKTPIPKEVLELESSRIRDLMIEMLEEIDINRARDGVMKNPAQSTGAFSGLRS